MNSEDAHSSAVERLHSDDPQPPNGEDAVIECGNQHTCTFDVTVAALDRDFQIEVSGSAMSKVIGFDAGPRPLVWKETELVGEDPDLGRISVTLDPERDNAGTLIPLAEGKPFPAINRNTYYFVITVGSVGSLRSRRPAIVEGNISGIPPNAVYELKNGPIEFFLDPEDGNDPIATLTTAQTRVGSPA